MGRLLADLRQDPAHAPEIGLLYTFWALRGRLETNSARLQAGGVDPTGEIGGLTVPRSSVARARLDGAMTGTSFLVATPIALLSIWINQISLVLAIAASAGLDPADPLRIAEFLVVSGRYDTVEEAATVLSSIPAPRPKVASSGWWTAVAGLVTQVPVLLGLGIRRVRSMGLREAVVLIAAGVGCLLPVVGIPVFGFTSGRETTNLGRSAVRFYSSAGSAPAPAGLSLDLHARAWKGPRRVFAAGIVLVLAALALATWHWLGGRHGVRAHVLLAVVWAWVVLTFANLAVTIRRAGCPRSRRWGSPGQCQAAPALEGSVPISD